MRWRTDVTASPEALAYQVDTGEPVLRFTIEGCEGARLEPGLTDVRYWNARLELERYRGLPDTEELWPAARAVLPLRRGAPAARIVIAAAAPGTNVAAPSPGRSAELADSPAVPTRLRALRRAARSFLVARRLKEGKLGSTVIAGYPWFGDWGRDTMISLPGLTVANHDYEAARTILRTFARYEDRGTLPDLFPDANTAPEYNAVDAALWYFEATRAYFEHTEGTETLAAVLPMVRSILEYYYEGTRYGIHVEVADGLLYAGEKGLQLTWMDARVNEQAITPRTGKAVEINALWHHALLCYLSLARIADPDDTSPNRWADSARRRA